jgi:Flp pilus assembly protein TadD
MKAAKSVALLALLSLGCAGVLGHRHSDTFEARKRLARELVARQDWPAAFFYADQLHREDPADAEVLTVRGSIYRERGLPGEAEADLNDALARRPDLAEAHAALAILFDVTGRGPDAEAHHRRAAALAPGNASYLNNLGFSLYLRKKPREAVEAYQRAVRLGPTNPRIRTNLGFAYAAAGDLPRAAREFEMGAPPPEAKNNLGFAYEQRGDLANAYELYLAAVRLDPRFERARANLMHVAGKLGKPVPADVALDGGEANGRPSSSGPHLERAGAVGSSKR